MRSSVLLALWMQHAFCLSFDDSFISDGISLLQLRAKQHHNTNTSVSVRRALEDPGVAERAMCPHEIQAEEDAAGGKAFGCDGKLKAPATVQCSFWGEPHISEFFTGKSKDAFYDVFYPAGHYKLAAAKDGSWEIQTFNCGRFAQSVAIRLGKTVIEFINPTKHEPIDGLKVYVNGKREELPFEHGDVRLGESSLRSYQWPKQIEKQRQPGSCIDYKDLSIDFTSRSTHMFANGWVGLLIEAAADSVTTMEDDPHAICNWPSLRGNSASWPGLEPVPPEHSLFSRGSEICTACTTARGECNSMKQIDPDSLRVANMCRAKNIAVDDAASACAHLQDRGTFFSDCQLDYCFTGGEEEAALEAEAEEARENPQPICYGVAGDCDPGAACCNALRDQAKLVLDNVVFNDICGKEGGDRELRFGRALTQNGVAMDLVVSPVGKHDCGLATNDKFGTKTAEIGLLAVQAGREATFEFRFVKAGTSEPVEPTSLMLSFLDLDQGRNNKQRESIQVCNGAGVMVTDDNELDIAESAGCITVTSTTHGTGRDNPTSVEGMSQVQRARSAAFSVTGSSFQAKFSVSKRGNNARKFMFAGHPGVACVLK